MLKKCVYNYNGPIEILSVFLRFKLTSFQEKTVFEKKILLKLPYMYLILQKMKEIPKAYRLGGQWGSVVAPFQKCLYAYAGLHSMKSNTENLQARADHLARLKK